MLSTDSVVVITGTRKGIGRYITEYYTSKGIQVIGCSRTESDYSHPKYKHFLCDVSDEKNVRSFFRSVSKEFGRVDVLINNAGIASMNHSLLMPTETVRSILNTNFIGTFLFCQEAARLMSKRKNGRIVNFSTVAVPLNLEGEAVYAASKSAVETLTRVLAREFGKLGITVNAIGPTPIETDLIRNVPKDKLENLVSRQSLKRMGSYSDVINVIDFFVDEKSDFISGQVLYLGGV